MSFREVNTLRKSGELDKAIAMAEADIERVRDKWSCSALFWCLNDKIKTLAGEELSETVEQMKLLAETIGQDDEVVAGALQRADRIMNPIAAEVRKASEEAKTRGRAMSAYEKLNGLYDRGELEPSFYADFGWVIYRALHEDTSDNVLRRKKMLHKYLQLNLEQPSLLHSLILSEAVKIEKATPLQFLFSGFLNLWNLENLREEDWTQAESGEGNTIPSLVEKMITVYVKEMVITPTVSPSEAFLSVMEQALVKYPKNEHLPRYKAQLLIKSGRGEEAIAFYKKLIIKKPMNFYLWSELAELTEDENCKIGLLCKGLSYCPKEEFLGKLHVALAKCFVERQMYSNAVAELTKVREVYQSHDWKNLPPGFYETYRQIPSGTEPTDNKALYRDYAPKADEYVYSEFPAEVVVKISEKVSEMKPRDGRPQSRNPRTIVKWTLKKADGSIVYLNPAYYALPKKAPVGTCLSIRISRDRIVTAVILNAVPETDWVREVKGKLERKISHNTGKPFGFVKGHYVAEKLLKGQEDGAQVKGIAIKGKDHWQMISLEAISKD